MARASIKSIGDRLAGMFSAQAKAAADIRRDLDQIGEDIIAAQNRLSDTRRRPATREEIEGRVVAELAASVVAFQDETNLSVLSDPNGGNIIPPGGGSKPVFTKSATIGLAYLANPDGITAALVDAAVAATPGEPISASEREREIGKLEAEIADLEKLRERFAREAERHGLRVNRSEFADPAALLADDTEL